jgi:hypothetical protein
MTARYVRDTIRTWASQCFACPFYDSINQVIAPPHAAVWATVEFDPTADTLADFCGGRESAGLADFIFAAPPNTKDSEVLDVAATSIERLMRFVDTNGLTLTIARQPEELSNGTADHNYRLAVGVEYRFAWRQALAPALPLPMP